MGNKILTFGHIEVGKNKFYLQKSYLFKRCRY